MPIRMVDDPQEPKNNDTGGKRGGIPPILLLFLPYIFKFLIKKPKLLLGVIAIGVLFYFFGGNLLGGGETADADIVSPFSRGLDMKQEVYEQGELYEPLATNYKSGLPSRVSLEQFCPPRLNQGSQGSCVAWSSSYAARTILHAKSKGVSGKEVAFSPSSLYNFIKLPNCQGAYIHNAMQQMQQYGVLPFNEFSYDEYDCNRTPSQNQMAMATQYRTRGFQRLWENEGGTDISAIKQNLSQGGPVVIGMLVGGSFMSDMMGRKIWHPTSRDRNMAGFGGHAMCVIGYDDNLEGGAFQIMNSWGEDWGDRGLFWIKYSDFEYFTREAYGLYPMGNAPALDPNKLSVDFGLVTSDNLKNIPLTHLGNGIFRTSNNIAKGTRFKIEVTNSIECYIYVFGEETDGSSYVLFPNPQKKNHSAYCGITGTRLFPRTESLMADNIGNADRMAVVVSKVELDHGELNRLINQATGNYAQKVQSVLSQYAMTGVTFQSGANVHFDATIGDKKTVAMVIEVTKQ
ncbi:MAG: peptidase C1 [Flavobacteriales bacterium]|nr:peptidase C1 [Flavobacteriales bacterium]